MGSDTGWQELRTKTSPRCPKLFYKFEVNDNGYNLQFTDLVALWSTASDTGDIQSYAKQTRASIDPTEASQYTKLLEKLAESLAEGKNSIRQDDSSTDEAIILSTSIQLKKPLQPLKWEFFLEPQGASQMAESILRPCLHEASEAEKKVESLLSVIADKDRVISRLLDKFEGSAIDLSLVFPSITGVRARKGQVTVKQAQKHVPGLAQFSPDEWRKDFNSDSPYSTFEASSLSKLITGCERCPKHTPEEHQRWLERLPKTSATASQVAKIEANRSSSPINDDSDSETQFETQEKRGPKADREDIPVSAVEDTNAGISESRAAKSLKQSSANFQQRANGNSTGSSGSETTSESDLDAAPKPKRKRKLGTLGKKSKSPPRLDPSRSPTRQSNNSPLPQSNEGHEKEKPSATKDAVSKPSSQERSRPKSASSSSPSAANSESDKDMQLASDVKSADSKSTPPRLGRVGKLRKAASATPDHKHMQDQSTSNKEREAASTQTTPTRHRLGRLGRGTSQTQPAQPDYNNESPSPYLYAASNASTASTASPSPPASPTRNTDQQEHHKAETSSRPSSRDQHTDALQDVSSISQSQSQSQPQPPSHNPTPEPEVQELTKEEKANQRREELKRKIEGTGAGAAGHGGLRKKRKF